MADKAEKIAAARKKLKEFQSKTKTEKKENSDFAINEDQIQQQQNALDSFANGNLSNYFNDSPAQDDIFNTNIQGNNEETSLTQLNQLSADMNNLITNNFKSSAPLTSSLELETNNFELASLLNAEKHHNDELQLKLRNQNSFIDELKIQIDKLKLENNVKLTTEMGPLQEQLQHHIQTVGILVGEKAELTASLNRYQNLSKEKTNENDELQNRLKASRHTVQKLEKEIETMKKSNMKFDDMERKISNELTNYQQESEKFKKLYEGLQEDLAELKQKLIVRNQEYSALQEKQEKSNSELSLCKLRIEQLSGDENQDFNSKMESLTQQNFIKTQQIHELQESIKQLGTERDQSNQQYQNYVLHLNREVSNFADKIQELTQENERLSNRENNLVKHISELEKQIQQTLTKQQNYAQLNSIDDPKTVALEGELKILREKVSTFEMERAEYMKQNEAVEQLTQKYEEKLRENAAAMNDLQMTVERLQIDKPDAAKLIAEIECGKVGASRAVAQNVELKLQLEEMQKAFVQISNDKLELTDKLQTELHLCKEMKSSYSQMESDLTSIREKLHFKDEEMIRLTHESTELNKQLFQQNQEIDRLRYYEARNNDGNVLQIELQNSKELVRMLQSKIKEFDSRSTNGDCDNNQIVKDENCMTREIDTLKYEKDELLRVINNFQNRNKVIEANIEQCNESFSDNASTVTIPTHEAMEKLQARFKRTMGEVADLTEEKQRLEHIVMQLQGETETIGEYISLYQQQRRLLKQKDMERGFQLQTLADDREQMKIKLKELNDLVHQLVAGKSGDHVQQSNVINYENEVPAYDPQTSSATAGRILSLLSDIKTANITYGNGVQHCSCCSGKLETV